MIGRLSLFINCYLLISLSSAHVCHVFLNDWVRTIATTMRIIADRAGPGVAGESWAELSHICGWEMIHAPGRAPNLNGLAEHSTRSLKIGIKNIIDATPDAFPCREIVTQAVIANNHAPRTATGIPPDLATAGRCDIPAGFPTAEFNHNPDKAGDLLRANNNIRNITNSRNAIIFPDDSHAVRAMIDRKLPDRYSDFAPVDSEVQIAAADETWKGPYRAIANLHSNIITERDGVLTKWPECRARLIRDLPMGLSALQSLAMARK